MSLGIALYVFLQIILHFYIRLHFSKIEKWSAVLLIRSLLIVLRHLSILIDITIYQHNQFFLPFAT